MLFLPISKYDYKCLLGKELFHIVVANSHEIWIFFSFRIVQPEKASKLQGHFHLVHLHYLIGQ
jgi:hypothetical protein